MHPAQKSHLDLCLKDISATNRFGKALADVYPEGFICALKGPLGAGKTALVKALGQAIGVKEVISSPTFTMLNEYVSGRLPLYHLDLYRAHETGETMDLGFLSMELEELLCEPSYMMAEWPQYFLVEGQSFFAGRDYLEIELEISVDVKRSLSVQPAQSSRVLREATGPREENKEPNVALDNSQNFAPEKEAKPQLEGEERIAHLRFLGRQEEAVISHLGKELADILIYL